MSLSTYILDYGRHVARLCRRRRRRRRRATRPQAIPRAMITVRISFVSHVRMGLHVAVRAAGAPLKRPVMFTRDDLHLFTTSILIRSC